MQQADTSDRDFYGADISSPPTPRIGEDAQPAAAHAAVALAQLHHDQLNAEWDSDAVSGSLTLALVIDFSFLILIAGRLLIRSRRSKENILVARLSCLP